MLLATYVVVVVVVLVAEAFGSPLAVVAGWFAMPLLAEMVVVSVDPPRPREVVLVVAALGFFFLGHALPGLLPADAGVSVLFVMHGVGFAGYLAALFPQRRESLAWTKRSWLGGYGLFYVVLVFAVRDRSGPLLVPLLVFGAIAVAVAILSSALGLSAAFGGALVLLSNGLTAMHEFTPGWDKPGLGFWIALTGLAGQGLFMAGVLQRWQTDAERALRRWSQAPQPAGSR